MNAAESAARAARRTEEWRRANARLFHDNLQEQLTESLDYAIAGAIASDTLTPIEVLRITAAIDRKLRDFAGIETGDFCYCEEDNRCGPCTAAAARRRYQPSARNAPPSVNVNGRPAILARRPLTSS